MLTRVICVAVLLSLTVASYAQTDATGERDGRWLIEAYHNVDLKVQPNSK